MGYMIKVTCAAEDCSETVFIMPHQDKTADHFCAGCYNPENPTTGWMRKEYRKRGLDDHEFSEFLRGLPNGNNGSKIDKWLQKKLRIDPKKKDESKSSVNR